MKPAIPGTRRHTARSIIAKVIEDHVHGPVQLLQHGDVLELRKVLRQHYPFGEFKYHPYEVWREEVRAALGYADPRPRGRKKKPFKVPARNIMPSMREWAARQGILAEGTL